MAIHPEDPNLWRKIHNLWISEIYQSLKPQVAGKLSLSIDQEITLIELDSTSQRFRPDLHLSERSPERPSAEPAPGTKADAGALVFAEGFEACSTESRHYLVLRDLSGARVIAVLEILSPTNKGYYAKFDFDQFHERRQRLLGSLASYMEIDGVPIGTRWLPNCLKDLAPYRGVAWFSVPRSSGRHFKGWAWTAGGPLPKVPWELEGYGPVELDLDGTFTESLLAAGLSPAR